MNYERDAELIDLGSVTEETKGGGMIPQDFLGGLQVPTGLSDD